jgi:hypothetical protein
LTFVAHGGCVVAFPGDTERVVAVFARWSLLAIGVFLATVSFVEMMKGHNEPWWWTGLIGVAATTVGLGSPWSSRRRPDADS